MTASEKLRALDGTAESGPWERYQASNLPGDGPVIKNADNFDWVATVQVSNVSNWRDNASLIVALRNALPLIADVVEAAEKHFEMGEGCAICGRIPNVPHADDCVLAALNEHLEAVT